MMTFGILQEEVKSKKPAAKAVPVKADKKKAAKKEVQRL